MGIWMRKVEKLAVVIIGLLVAFVALWQINNYFINNVHDMPPEVAGVFSIIVFLAVLAYFELIAFKADL